MFNANLKRGSMELLILSALEGATRHGYEIGKLLEHRSGGQLEFRVSTLYTVLYRMEDNGWIKGRWVEKEGERRRCYYTLTPAGEAALEAQRKEWRAFAKVVNEMISPSPA
ncbi:MAG: PadR family transcriptional regulator [Longimicrobiales bacterium]